MRHCQGLQHRHTQVITGSFQPDAPRNNEPHVGAWVTSSKNLLPITELEEMKRQFLDKCRDFIGTHALKER